MALTIADLRPGDIGFGPLSGAARAAMWGQFILGEGFSVGPLNIGHVFVVTDVVPDARYDHQRAFAVEAMPKGAQGNVPIGHRWTDRYAYVRLPEDYPGQAADAAAIARAMIGTPYSFASYLALAAWRFHLRTPRLEKWIDRRRPDPFIIPTPGHVAPRVAAHLPAEAICSVLADQAWSLAGKSVMRGVAHQCVTPGALAGRLLTTLGAQWIWPGVS